MGLFIQPQEESSARLNAGLVPAPIISAEQKQEIDNLVPKISRHVIDALDSALQKNARLAKLFEERPALFIDIVKGLKGESQYLFNALQNQAIANAFADDPDKLSGLQTTPKTGLVGLAKDVDKATMSGANSAFEALQNPSIANLFASDPERILDIFLAFTNFARSDSESAFAALAVPSIAKLFVQSPENFVKLLDAADSGAGSVLYILQNADIAYLFTHEFSVLEASVAKIAQASGNDAKYAFEAMNNKDIAGMFIKNVDMLASAFVELTNESNKIPIEPYKVSTRWAQFALSALQNPDIAGVFAKNPKNITQIFIEIAKFSGVGARAAFYYLQKKSDVSKRFADNPQSFVDKAKEAKEKSAEAFREMAK